MDRTVNLREGYDDNDLLPAVIAPTPPPWTEEITFGKEYGQGWK